ncbi:DUF5686 family protein [Candidatus Latescibacterota bacterium]
MKRYLNQVILFVVLTSFSLNTSTAYAQESPIVIEGSIRDSSNNQPLSAAQVRINGTRSGTITNDDGVFSLEIPALPAVITISYIGYESREISITSDSTESLDILLEPRIYVLPTVIVTSGSTAEIIMRRVIERKKDWYASLNTYKADAYTRMNIASDTEIAFISESISVLFWDKEQGEREDMTFVKNTENIPGSSTIASARMVPNLYDDNVEVLGYDMVGLTHPDALDYYTFKIIEQKFLDNKTVYVMSVEPKSKLQPLFRGTVSILDEDFAMIDLDLTPNEAAIYPVPISGLEFSVKQQFSNFGEDIWLPVDVRVSGKIKVKLGFLLELPTINYSQVSHFSDYEINIALPDSLYDNENVLNISIGISNDGIEVDSYEETKPEGEGITVEVSEKGAVENPAETADSTAVPVMSEPDSLALVAREASKDSLFTLNRNAIPLTVEEEEAYATIDSTTAVDQIFKPTGLLTKVIDMDNSDNGQNNGNSEENNKEKSRFSKALSKITSDTTPEFWHNRVDGFHFGLNWEKRYKKRVRYNFGAGKSKSLEQWSWNVGTELFLTDKRKASFILSAFSGTETRQNTSMYPLPINSILTIGGFEDYFDYYWNDKVKAAFRYNFQKNNMVFETAFNNESPSSLMTSTFYDLRGKKGKLRVNPAVNEDDLRSVSMRLNFGQGISPLSIEGAKGGSFSIEHSSPEFLGGNHTFTQYNADVVWRIETYLKRRLFPMTLDIRFAGSTSAGKLPIHKFSSLDTRFLGWTPFGTFRSLATRPIEGEHHAALFVEHNFRTVPLELIGLRSLAEKNIGIIAHGAAGRTWIGSNRLNELTFTPNYYDSVISEAGISINNLFGFLRLDYTKRLDRRGHTFGINIARIM